LGEAEPLDSDDDLDDPADGEMIVGLILRSQGKSDVK
jgi:hypothetical protein